MSTDHDVLLEKSMPNGTTEHRAGALARARYHRIYTATWRTYRHIVGFRGVKTLADLSGYYPNDPAFQEFAARHIEAIVLSETFKWGMSFKPPHELDRRLIYAFFGLVAKGRSDDKLAEDVMFHAQAYQQELDIEAAIARDEARQRVTKLRQDFVQAYMPTALNAESEHPAGVDRVIRSNTPQ